LNDISTHVAATAPEIAIITVQYGNPSDTVAFLKTVAATMDSNECEIVIVDNGGTSNDSGELNALREIAPCAVHYLRPEANRYYWGGAALAIETHYPSTDLLPRWLIICNNDVLVRDQTFFQTLRRLAPAVYPIIAPSIIANGKDQNPLLESPPSRAKRVKWQLYDLDYRVAKALLGVHAIWQSLSRPFRRIVSARPANAQDRHIYAPHGAFVILSKQFFEAGGELDTTVPMFAEELTLAALAERLRLPVWYVPRLQVLHRPHSTTGSRLTRAKYELERRARRHYFALAAAGS
jgi:GT2 family glycosyltransferase